MKYNIEGFDQARCVALGLKIFDIIILRWFVDFIPFMKKIYKDGTTYYFVKYQAIIDEFPIMDIGTSRAIANHFELLCQKNILKKYTHHESNGGTFLYFACTEKIHELMYSPEKVEQKTQEAETKQTASRLQESVAETKISSARQGAETKIASARLNNPSITSLNDSTTLLTHEEMSKSEVADFFKNKIKILFGGEYFFDERFAKNLVAFFNEADVSKDEALLYLEFCYQKTKDKKPDNENNYFYKIVLNKVVLENFLHDRTAKKADDEKEVQAHEVTCPVCNKKFDGRVARCPKCQFYFYNTDQNKINFAKQIYLLPREKKKQFESEYKTLLHEQAQYDIREILRNSSLSKKINDERHNFFRKWGIKTNGDIDSID